MYSQKCDCGRLLYEVEDPAKLPAELVCRHCGSTVKVEYYMEPEPDPEPEPEPKPATKPRSRRKSKP